MRPDLQFAMRTALAQGPAWCPADLFEGSTDRVLLGLKVHANTISHARHVALEETYPRTRDLIGAERFHAITVGYLERDDVGSLPITEIGCHLSQLLSGGSLDLARLEWAWLQAHGAADEPAFDLSILADLTPEEVVAARVTRHPAAKIVEIAQPMKFDGVALDPPGVVVTRPMFDVMVTQMTPAAADLLDRLHEPARIGELLELDAAATTLLVTAGAFARAPEALP